MPAPNGMDPRHWEYISQRLGKKTYADGDAGAPPPPTPSQPAPPPPPSQPAPPPPAPAPTEEDPSTAYGLRQGQHHFGALHSSPPPNVSPEVYATLSPQGKADAWQSATAPHPQATPPAKDPNETNPGLLNDVWGHIKKHPEDLYYPPAAGIRAAARAMESAPQYSETGGQYKEPPKEGAAGNPDKLPGYSGEENPQGASQGAKPAPVALAQYVPAHEEPKVNPERQNALGQAIDAEGNAVLAAGDIKENAMNVGADAQMAAAQQESADLDRIAENQKARQDYLDKLGQDIDQDSKGMSQKTYDPDRLWNSKSTAQKIFGIIAMALGGFVQGVHGGRNGPADMIEESIKEDIGAQKEQLSNQWADIKQRHSVLSEKATRYGSMDVAERQQVAARLQGALLMAQAAAARATSPVERANATALAAQLEQKAIMAGIEMNKWVNAGYAGGAGGANEHPSGISTEELYNLGGGKFLATGDAERARALEKQNNAADLVANNSQEMLAILTGPNYARAYVPGTAEYGALRALSKSMAVQDVSDASGGASSGRSLGLLNVYSQVQGNLSNPFMIGSVKKSLQTLADEAQAHKEIRLQGYAGAPIVTVRGYKDHAGAMKRGVFMSADGETFEPPKKPPTGNNSTPNKFTPAGQ